ncbi:unnamed protein product [Heligmosomoides polygyrus]|uniref:GCN5-related N-acetyltransferase n=1 Tax=Heligmosomoides polygyrus TaxID=6339 RepID=A0A183G7S8_HELPZ|nr:unnamed protein product [Heligmosomoides polygyrus]
MRFACAPKNDARELYAFMADIQYFPSAPPVPGNIQLITNIYRDMIETSDHQVYNVIWTTPDINAFPARINFRIPTSSKSVVLLKVPIKPARYARELAQTTSPWMTPIFVSRPNSF